jgi:hypothetical protein
MNVLDPARRFACVDLDTRRRYGGCCVDDGGDEKGAVKGGSDQQPDW